MSLNYRSLLLVVLFTSVLFSFKLGSYALVDMDEPRYPQAAREMIAKKEYIIPQFAGKPRYDKPILFYWSEILSIKAFGDNELSARLPSAISALALVILSFFIGSTTGVAMLSALVLATSIEFFVMARLSVTDMLLNLCISSTLIIFFLTYSRKRHPTKRSFVSDAALKKIGTTRSVCSEKEDNISFSSKPSNDKFLLLSAVSAALGVLCKGPVALILPGLIIFFYLLANKDLLGYCKRVWSLLLVWILIFLVLVLPWYIAVHYATAGEFTKAFFLEHNLNRYTSVVSGHKAAWWFYVPTFIIGFMPWALFLPKAFTDWFKNKAQVSYENDLVKFSLIWFTTVIVFYSLASTKLINYILPCYLPLAIIVAIYLKKSLTQKTITIIIAVWGIALLASVLLVLMPLSERLSGGIRKFSSMLPAETNLYTVNIERPSVTYYGHLPAKRIKSSKLVTKLNNDEELYFVIKTNDLKEIQVAKDNYQIMFQDHKYSFGKS